MVLTASTTRTSVLGASARIAVLLFVFGLAECAAGSCLSYGHSCWGAHGKRNGGNTSPPDDAPVPDDAGEGLAAATPEDTRWFLSKLVQQADPATKNKLWQRFGNAHAAAAMDRRPWKNNLLEEDPASAILRENEPYPRSRGVRLDGSDESSPGILIPASGEFPEENQDADVLVMADEQPIRRVPKKLRVFKIMHPGRKMDK